MANEVKVKGETALTETDYADLVHGWLKFEKGNGASDNTLAAYRKGIQVFWSWADGRDLALSHVEPLDVVDFKSELAEQYSPQTVNLRLVAVRAFYRFLVNKGRALVNPASEVKGVKRSKSRSHKRDALTGAEVLRVLDGCDVATLAGRRDLAMLSLMAYCGLRSVEVHRANMGDLRTRGDRLTLDVQGKGRVEADEYVIIPEAIESVVRSWLSERSRRFEGDALFVSLSPRFKGDRLSLRAIRHLVKSRFAAAGVVGEGKTTHSLRHSAITNAIRRGASPMQVQSMARHQSFDTTLAYFHEVSRLDNPAEDVIDYSNGK